MFRPSTDPKNVCPADVFFFALILEVHNATCDTRKLKFQPFFFAGRPPEANFFDGRQSGANLIFNLCGCRRRGGGPVRRAPAAAVAAAAKIGFSIFAAAAAAAGAPSAGPRPRRRRWRPQKLPSVRPSVCVRPSVRVRPRPSAYYNTRRTIFPESDSEGFCLCEFLAAGSGRSPGRTARTDCADE